MLACAAYLGTLSVINNLIKPGGREFPILEVVTIVVSWLVMCWVYYGWKMKLPDALGIHLAGPVLLGFVGLIVCSATIANASFPQTLILFLCSIVFGQFMSIFMGFPLIVLILLAQLLETRRH
jgi:uncharacterized membrane protein YtjA (UPF0391 family)